MTMAEQGGGKGWRSSALTLPAQPPASWRTSERTFVWAAKLNLPPSCQGIGKAVRGEEKGESGGRSSGREGGGREASRLSEPQLLRHCLPRVQAAPRQAQPGLRTPKQGPDLQGSGVPHRVPDALGPRLERGSRSVPPAGRGGKGSRGRKSLLQVEGESQAAPPSDCPPGRGGGPGPTALARSRPGCLHSWSVF